MSRFIENIHSLIERSAEDSVELDRNKRAIIKAVEVFYRVHTARETCEAFGMQFTPRMVKLLHRMFPKGMGWGGARKGAGNKKGWREKQQNSSQQ